MDLVKGNNTRNDALKRHEAAIAECEATRMNTQRVCREYGEFQIRVHKETVARLADWLERNEHLVKRINFKRIDGVRIEVPSAPTYAAGVEDVTTGISGLIGAVGAGTSAQAAALWGVSTFASASTGTAISSLSGAAAQNAVLAWLGGGSLATGGGGVAAGSVVLGAVTVVPGLLIGGLTVGIVGARTRTKLEGFAATVDVEIKQLFLTHELLHAVERRIDELRDLLSRMAERATHTLEALEAVNFDPEVHAAKFLRALQLVTAVKEILNTPVLDPQSGELTEASIKIMEKYA
ncbi:hypothetical protein ABZ780_13280 [Micromonospora sp. NPDC047467]|uniref:hypothetical protein n=1 Tax=Micromonospora sp. NPDC047467 TaxID=3154814 RepID=UPI0033D0E382